MKLDSRLILLAVLAAGGLSLVWSALGESEPDRVGGGSEMTAVPDRSSPPEAAEDSAAASSAPTAAPTTVTVPSTTTTTFPVPEVLAETHPPLVDIDGWLQSEVETLEELRGRVVVVEFWTFGCYNCKNRIPHTQKLYDRYRDQGLEIVGIHSPEFRYEEDVDNISGAMETLGVSWPVALDTGRRTFWEWQTGGRGYWPRTYVLDRDGRVRFDHIGEGKYRELEQTVAYLLQEAT